MNGTKRTALGAAITGLALVAAACVESPVEPGAASLSRAADGPDPTFPAGVVASVTGNAHFISEDVERTATFRIVEYADGTVEGWYHALRRGPGGARVRVAIDCLHVVGNEAWASGIVVEAVGPDNIGRPYTLRFVDHGEGNGALPDEIGVGRFMDFDCMTEPDLGLRPLTIGNLQVRG